MARRLEVVVVGDTRDLERALGRAGHAGTTFGQKIQRGARIAGLALGGGLALAARAGFKELEEGQKVTAQTNAVLKSTGNVANVTAGHVTDLATSLSKMSGIDDEAIQAGENLLLTFKGIRNEVGAGNDIFDQATVAALDLSVALGKDLNSSSIMLGKALNDPVKGLTALGRAGVQFTEGQKETIKALVATGDTLGAQKIILKELESQVGGSAAAYGDTLPGQIGKARNAFDEMSGALLLSLLPAMTAVSGALLTFSEFMEAHPKLAKGMTIALIALTAALLTAASAQAILNLAVLANPYVAAAAAALTAAAALVVLYEKSEKFRNAVNLLKDNWNKLLFAFGLLPGLAATIIKNFDAIQSKGSAAFNAVKAVVQSFIEKVRSAIDAVGDFIRKVGGVTAGPFGAIVSAVQSVVSWVRTAISWVQRLIDLINKIPHPSFGGGSGGEPSGGGRGSQAPGSQRGMLVPDTGTGGKLAGGPIVIQIDGREIYRSVKTYAAMDSRRNG